MVLSAKLNDNANCIDYYVLFDRHSHLITSGLEKCGIREMIKLRLNTVQPTSTNLNSAPFSMSQTNLAKHRLERHLVVSSFVRDVLHDLGVRTVSDLCELRITAVQKINRMGVKRIAEVRGLIGAAKKLRKSGKTTEKPAKKTTVKNRLGQITHLVFVPDILKTVFDQLGIDSVESLLSIDCDVLSARPNLGSKKVAAAIGLQSLYKRLASPPKNAAALRVSDLVPEILLPNSCVGRLSMEDFLSGDDGGRLVRKALRETSNLRMLLRTTLRRSCDPLHFKELEWRDVGLRVPSRVETVAKKYNLKTVADLEDLAIFGCVTHSTSKGLTRRSQKDNLGDKSIGSLREELRRLQVMGVQEYQKQLVCSLADIDCPITPWFDVPLRVPKRIRDFLNAYQVVTISDVHRILIRNQVYCNAQKDWLPLSKCRGLSESPLEKLRQEVRRLQSMGLQAYRKQFVCLLEDIDCLDMPWYDVPLRVSSRAREFLKAFDIVTISEVHRVVLREQAFCRVRRVWVDFSEINNFSDISVGELRDELGQLALLGKERYQMGGAFRPKTLKELATAALKRLDRRERQIVKARCAGAAYAVPARRLSVTGERVRQIAMTAFKRLECFRPIATELMKQFVDSLPRDVKSNDFELGRQLGLDEKWHFSLLLNLSGYSPEPLTRDVRR
jgi:hypothetical protein